MSDMHDLLRRARELAARGDHVEAVEAATAARNLSTRAEARDVTVQACLLLARLQGRTAKWMLTDRALLQAELTAEAAGDRDAKADAVLLGIELSIEHDLTDLAERMRRLDDLPRGTDLAPALRGRAAAVRAWWDARNERPGEAARWLDAALEHSRASRDTETRAWIGLMLARVWMELGQTHRAVAEASSVLTLAADARRQDLSDQARRALGSALGTVIDPRVEKLLTVATEVARNRDPVGVLNAVCSATAALVDIDRVFVILKEADGSLEVKAGTSRWGEPGRPSMSIVRRALRLGREVVATDAAEDESFAANSVIQMGLATVMCVPLGDSADRILGVIYADSTRVPRQDAEDAVWLLRALGAHAAVAVSNARSFEQGEQRTRAARETIHDVRSLVCAIQIGLEDVLAGAELPEWVAEVLRTTHRMNDSVLRQVEGALGRRGADVAVVEVGDLAHEIALFLAPEARRRGCALRVEAGEAPVRMDPDDLGRVLTNLISNAIKYSPPDTAIEVEARSDANRVYVTVRDRGPGIPVDDLPHVFESGFQARGAAPGLGLGLGICHRLVEGAGGRITASNRPDGGTEMAVQLPRHRG